MTDDYMKRYEFYRGLNSEATMEVGLMIGRAKKAIDFEFGRGTAQKKPELVMAFMQCLCQRGLDS